MRPFFILSMIAAMAGRFAYGQSVALPLNRLSVNSGFGWRYHPLSGKLQFHRGVDLFARTDSVWSVLDGTVEHIGNDLVTGNYVIVSHGSGIETLYGHLSAIAVWPGDPVPAGGLLGITGATGRVTGEHLHFAVRSGGRDLPPLLFLLGLSRPP